MQPRTVIPSSSCSCNSETKTASKVQSFFGFIVIYMLVDVGRVLHLLSKVRCFWIDNELSFPHCFQSFSLYFVLQNSCDTYNWWRNKKKPLQDSLEIFSQVSNFLFRIFLTSFEWKGRKSLLMFWSGEEDWESIQVNSMTFNWKRRNRIWTHLISSDLIWSDFYMWLSLFEMEGKSNRSFPDICYSQHNNELCCNK